MRLLQGQFYQQAVERKTMFYPYKVLGMRHVDH